MHGVLSFRGFADGQLFSIYLIENIANPNCTHQYVNSLEPVEAPLYDTFH